jgi:hypothetical protein
LTNRQYQENALASRGRAASLDNRLDGYRFGTANSEKIRCTNMNEKNVLRMIREYMSTEVNNWSELDKRLWSIISHWDYNHSGLQASRVCLFLVINRSDSPVQISRLQMVHGKTITLFGSLVTGYESESRCVMPEGIALVVACGFSPSPIEVGHLKAVIDCPAFRVVIASTQRESACEGKSGFRAGFLEKSVTEWWSKYVLIVS